MNESSSVLRRAMNGSASSIRNPHSGITVQCPKCQQTIVISEFRGDEPLRCAKCFYPMIHRSDLLLIVEACKNSKSANSIGILRHLANYIPEAGTALGAMASKGVLTINDSERWDYLNRAYTGGDENAREWLNIMCQSNPWNYKRSFCRHCGAPKYYTGDRGEITMCVFCHSRD